MKRKVGLCSLVVLMAVLLLVGCGGPEGTDEPVEEPANGEEEVIEEEVEENNEGDEASEQDEDALSFEADQYVLPETFPEFIASFEEIRYTGGDVDGQQSTVQYKHLGEEEINGVVSDKIEIRVNEEEAFVLWVDSTGDFQKVIAGGEEIPVEMAQQLAKPLLNAAMAPFYQASRFNLENIFTEQVPGYEYDIVGTEKKTFGAVTATVYIIEVSIGPPAVEDNMAAGATIHIADLDDFKVITYWETTEIDGDSSKGIFKIDEFVLR